MNPRLFFNEENSQWILETPVALNLRQVDKAVKFASEMYKRRWAGTIGEKRKSIERAIKLLNPTNVRQRLVGEEPTLFHTGKY